MKIKNKRGFPIPIRITVSAVLVIFQLVMLFSLIYGVNGNSIFVYTLTMILGIFTVIYIINQKGNPDHKIAWIIFILLFPIFGISSYILWGGGRVPPHVSKRMKKCEARYMRLLKQDNSVYEQLKYYDLFHSRQADYLNHESLFPLYRNTNTKFLPSGEAFLETLLSELKKAQKYIFIEFFILAEGKMWDVIHEILKEKTANGVEVKIIFDDFGSIKRQQKGFITNLKSEGIEVSVFNPINPFLDIFMNNRSHRKIVIIDGKTAFTGGVNIGDEYINLERRFGHWQDSAIMISGDAVKSFLAMFCTMWEFTTGKTINMPSHVAENDVISEGFVLPYCDGPLNSSNPAEGIYMKMLSTAQKYVYISTPYLLIDNNMKSVLHMAAKSGIDVRIVTPSVPDKWYVHPATQYNYSELLEAGIRIYEYTPGFIHSKVFVSDDKVATVGSVNMDYRSFVFHFECGAWICDNTTVFDIKESFKDIFAKSREITLKDWKKRPLTRRIKQAILHLFAPFM